MKREALLYDRLDGTTVRCRVCQWECRIADGKLGACRTRVNEGGTLYTLLYGEASSVNVDPIEKKPLFHFYPGSQVFSLGTWGCNFRCRHCQNWQISYARPGERGWVVQGEYQGRGQTITPRETVSLAKRYGCRGIAWTYNEPGIWLEQTLETAQLAREAGLYTVYVTNGYISRESLDLIGPFLDCYRVDIKGFTDRAYRDLARVVRWRGILDSAERARHRWGMHVEVVTNVVPTVNDDDEQLTSIAMWIRDSLGPETPWHVTRFFPHAEMSHLAPTPVQTLLRARKIGMETGLQFVYVGNVAIRGTEDTICPSCHQRVILRFGYHTNLEGVASGGYCRHCGAALNLRGC